jgi:hypothetical protein
VYLQLPQERLRSSRSGKTLGFKSLNGRDCKERGGKYAFAIEGSENISISTLQHHAKSVEHKKLSWAKNGGRKLTKK